MIVYRVWSSLPLLEHEILRVLSHVRYALMPLAES